MVHKTIHDGTYSSEVVIESLANALDGRLFGCVWIFELLRKTGTIPEEPFPQISAPYNAFPVLLRTVVLKMAHEHIVEPILWIPHNIRRSGCPDSGSDRAVRLVSGKPMERARNEVLRWGLRRERTCSRCSPILPS